MLSGGLSSGTGSSRSQSAPPSPARASARLGSPPGSCPAARRMACPPAAIMATLRTLWAAREMFPSQATALGNTFLHLGMDTDKENLKEGEETFANRPRSKPRIR